MSGATRGDPAGRTRTAAIHDYQPDPAPTLFGQADAYDRCGKHRPVGFCGHAGGSHACGRPIIAPSGCHRSRCETCCWDWLERATRRATRRLLALDLARWKQAHPGARTQTWSDKVLEDPDGGLQHLRMVHSTVSLEEDQDGWTTQDRYLEARREAAQLAKDAGFDGFSAIPHPYRIAPWIADRLREAGYGIGNGTGSLWEGVVTDALQLDNFQRYVTEGLHTHIVGVTGQRGTVDANLLPGDVLGEDDDVVKHLRDVDTVQGLWQVHRYLLTHVAPPDGSPAVTYYGDLAKAAKNAPLETLDELDEFFVTYTLTQVVGDRGSERATCRCESCEHTGTIEPIFDARTWIDTQEAEDREIDHEAELDVARRWSLYGVNFAVRRAVELGWVDPCMEHTEIDETDPDTARLILGLDRPPPNADEIPQNGPPD